MTRLWTNAVQILHSTSDATDLKVAPHKEYFICFINVVYVPSFVNDNKLNNVSLLSNRGRMIHKLKSYLWRICILGFLPI